MVEGLVKKDLRSQVTILPNLACRTALGLQLQLKVGVFAEGQRLGEPKVRHLQDPCLVYESVPRLQSNPPQSPVNTYTDPCGAGNVRV